MTQIKNSKVLIMATNGFQEDELFSPLETLKDNGADVHLASLKTDPISAGHGKTREITPDLTITDVNVEDYDALVLPGGVNNPDTLRADQKAVQIVRDFAKDNKIIAAICHAPWLLVEAGLAKGRDMTSYNSIKTDVVNAGANWKDEEVVVHNGIITSRSLADLEAFNAKLIEEIREGEHKRDINAKAA